MKIRMSRFAAGGMLLLAATFISPLSPATASPESPAPPSVSAPDDKQLISAQVPLLMKAPAAECPVPAEGESAVCVTPSKNTQTQGKKSSQVPTLMAIQPVPEWCRQAGVMAPNQYMASRFEACGNWEYTLRVTQTQNGVTTVTGVMEFTVTGFHYGSQNLPTVAHQITIIPNSITGKAVGTTAIGTASCSTNCTNGTTSFGTQVLQTGQPASGEFFYNSTATAAGAVGATGSTWNLTLKAPDSAAANTLSSVSAAVRCDTAVPGISSTGCVIPGITPYINYDGATWGGFGAHVKAAQLSGLPGALGGVPLHRLTDTALRDANRAKACPASLPRPAGYSCDEYPFASTLEGAYTGGGTARTLPWCQVALQGTPSTGPAGYSVCMIDANTNSAAGSVLNSALFVPKRVINGDAFNVHIS